jgi:chaperone BCS1
MVTRDREKNMVDLQSGEPWETVTLTTLSRSRRVWDELLNEAKLHALKKEEGKTVIYTSMVGDWRPFGQPRRRRPLHSVSYSMSKRNEGKSWAHIFIELLLVLSI